ncbi:hypothetical protein Tco_0899683 [Tanacetum coccineum]
MIKPSTNLQEFLIKDEKFMGFINVCKVFRGLEKQRGKENSNAKCACTYSMDHIRESQAEIRVLQAETRALQQQRRDDHGMWTRSIGRIQTLEIARASRASR